jgi:hypothetical protein
MFAVVHFNSKRKHRLFTRSLFIYSKKREIKDTLNYKNFESFCLSFKMIFYLLLSSQTSNTNKHCLNKDNGSKPFN